MKGIILAGGSGTRLYPITKHISKQLLPVYDKPMIYYPLYTLMKAKIRDILIITTKEDLESFKKLLGNGKKFGININYKVQLKPNGLAEALIIGESFIGNDTSALILGDNIFYGAGLEEKMFCAKTNALNDYSTIFGYKVKDPQRFGIMELDNNKNVISVEEKPIKPKSDYAITGLYFYPKNVSLYAKEIRPSNRGELEITDLNRIYLENNKLKSETLDDGYIWFDTGTFDSMFEACQMIKSIETQGDRVICSPEEIAYINNWITYSDLEKCASDLKNNSYGKYLSKVLKC